MSSAIPDSVNVVCMSVGGVYHPAYLDRMRSMLRRYMPVPFTLTCIVDRPHTLPADVQILDASKWNASRSDLNLTSFKLRLLDPEAMPFSEFIFFDTTLVIQKDMTPLLEYAFGRPEELVCLQDWGYDCYNTCVMRVRTGGELRRVNDEFEKGTVYPFHNPTDQDFLHAFVKDKGLEAHVATFPEPLIASYKEARKLNRRNPRAAREMVDRAIIVKFHGRPKMHQLLDPRYRILKIMLPSVLKGRFRDANFWLSDLEAKWR